MTDFRYRVYIHASDLIYSYMKHRQFPIELRRRIARYFKNYFEVKTALNEDVILNELDPDLRQEVGLFLCTNAVAKHYLFCDLPKGMLLKLGNVLKPVTAKAATDIIVSGEEGTEMFIMLKGEAVVVSNDTNETVLANLVNGQSFGETAAFDITPMRTATVRALDDCELFRLSQEDIHKAFCDVPATYEKMRLMVMQRIVENGKGNATLQYILSDLKKRKAQGSASAASALEELTAASDRLKSHTKNIIKMGRIAAAMSPTVEQRGVNLSDDDEPSTPTEETNNKGTTLRARRPSALGMLFSAAQSTPSTRKNAGFHDLQRRHNNATRQSIIQLTGGAGAAPGAVAAGADDSRKPGYAQPRIDETAVKRIDEKLDGVQNNFDSRMGRVADKLEARIGRVETQVQGLTKLVESQTLKILTLLELKNV